MKTTIDLPDELVTQAKIRAARERRTLKDLIEAGLRKELASPSRSDRPGPITWVTVAGGLPTEIDVADRETWSHWMDRTS